jgi:hypothetical protein
VQSGKLKALATTAAQRLPILPDLPTVAESGFPDFEASTWGAIIGPAGLPGSVVTKIAMDSIAQLQVPSIQERMAALGATPVGSKPEDAQAFVRAEVAKWQAVVTQAGIEKQEPETDSGTRLTRVPLSIHCAEAKPLRRQASDCVPIGGATSACRCRPAKRRATT